ncbi:MAG: GNAT family N-acetyltransferase [Actinomycetota bacterium]|nr:GNAT family N-acetyltransferase [Actinomycetota bacterium]
MTPPLAASNPSFQFRPYRDQDEPHVLELLQAAFGSWPREIEDQDPTELFRWKHQANPFGRSVMTVAEADGRLVGFAAWLRWRMTANDRPFGVLRIVDLAVHGSYRGHRLHPALVRHGQPHLPPDAAFTLSVTNERSRSGSRKLQAHELGVFPLLVRPRSPLRSAARRIRRRPGSPPDRSPLVEAEPAAAALGDGESISALLAQTERSNDRFTTVKDLDYLRWRYGTLGIYRAVRVERGGRLTGLAIFRIRPRGRSWVSTLCEVLVFPGDRRTARRLLDQVVHAAAVDYVICQFPPGSTARRAAMRCGFLRVRSGPVPTVSLLRQGVVPDPTEAASWAICLGDLDLL